MNIFVSRAEKSSHNKVHSKVLLLLLFGFMNEDRGAYVPPDSIYSSSTSSSARTTSSLRYQAS